MWQELLGRLRVLGWSIAATALAYVCLVLFVFTTLGLALIVVTAGVPILLGSAAVTRPIAQLHRRMVPGIDGGRPIPPPYLRPPANGVLARLGALLGDPARRRDWYWLLANGTVGLTLSIVGIVESTLDLLFWWLPRSLAMRTHAALARSLLSTSEKSRLALRIEQLTDSRAETVNTQAAELRRIERDLHDGAQARLVALGMNLALAEQQLDRDPEAVRQLLAEARGASVAALGELRDLVRGIHPPVLADRGLAGAVEALALAAPLTVDMRVDLGERRVSAAIESAVYFAVAEALTNVVKHAGAQHATITLVRTGQQLDVEVRDDGCGGADPARGTGLHGIERRLSAFDGALQVTSPDGGPTMLSMVLPCASSSPKTSPSSATG